MKLLRVTSCLLVLLLSLIAFSFVTVHPAAAQELNPPPPSFETCRAGKRYDLPGQPHRFLWSG